MFYKITLRTRVLWRNKVHKTFVSLELSQGENLFAGEMPTTTYKKPPCGILVIHIMSIPYPPCLELNIQNPIIHGCFLCFVQKPKVHLHSSSDHTLDSPELVPTIAWQSMEHSLCPPIKSNK